MRSRTLKSSLLTRHPLASPHLFFLRKASGGVQCVIRSFQAPLEVCDRHAEFGAIITAECCGKFCATNRRARGQTDGFRVILQRLLALQP